MLILLFLIFSISVSALVADTSGTQPQEEPAPKEEVAPPAPEPAPVPATEPDPVPQEEEEEKEAEPLEEEEITEEVADEEEPQAEEKPQKVTIKQSSNSEEETTEVEETEEETTQQEEEVAEEEETTEEELTPDPAPQEPTTQESAPAPKETAPQQQSSPPAPQNGGASAEAEEVYICNEEEIIWGSAGQCSAVVPQGQGGDSPTLTTIDNTKPNFEGEATIACIDNVGWIQDSNPIVTYCNPIETTQPQEPTTEEVVEEPAPATQEAVTGETSHGGCDAGTVTWGRPAAGRVCMGMAPSDGNDGDTSSSINNTVSGLTGSATFTCNGTSWVPDPSATCNNEEFSSFGFSVATDGTKTIIGGNGGVYVYETINADGTLEGQVLLPRTSDIDLGSAFGWSVAIDGDYAIVGADRDDNGEGTNAGSAYIYERDSATGWGNPIPLTLPTGIEEGSQFSWSVSISGDYAIVGAPFDDSDIDGDGNTDTDVGSAYIYERNTATEIWSDPISLSLPMIDNDGSNDTGLEANSQFGWSVAISGDYAIVGARTDDNERGDSVGTVYIYERSNAISGGNEWGDPIHLTGLERASFFGSSVAIDATSGYAIVGASNDDNGEGTRAGSAYIYERAGIREWGNPIPLTLPNGLEARSQFGESVAIDGNYAIVGAPEDDTDIDGDGNTDTDVGSAYIYERNSDGWNNPIHLTLPNIDGGGTDDTGLEEDSRFGHSVAISQTHAVIGARSDDNEVNSSAGSAYTYNRAAARNWDLLASTTRASTLAFAGCDATTTPETWDVGGRTCSANLVASGHGDMSFIHNTATGFGGSATFTCNDGAWAVDQSTATCAPEGVADVSSSSSSSVPKGGDVVIDVSHSENADVEITVTDSLGNPVRGVTFTPLSVTGTSPTPVTVTLPNDIEADDYDLTVTLKNPAPDGSTISISDPIDISVREGANCNAGPVTWGLRSRACVGSISAGDHGALSSTIEDTTIPIIGSATFTCSDGTWEPDPSATCTNEDFVLFGHSVSTDGTRTIVGGVNGVHIYETIDNTNGTLGGKVLLPTTYDIDVDSEFGSSVAISGNYAIVGARNDDNDIDGDGTEEVDVGSAYIYERTSSGRGTPIALTPPTGLEAGSNFGWAVAIDGDYAIVGAPGDDNNGVTDIGSAYIYERTSSGWGTPIALTLPPLDSDGSDATGLASGSNFGWSVAISGDYAIVGTLHSAYIYERDDTITEGSEWGNPVPLTLPNGLEVLSFFGWSVAIDGDYAIVGASYEENERGARTGSAYIYERDDTITEGSKWGNPIALTLPTSPSDGDPINDTGLEVLSLFGASVAIDSTGSAIVGAPLDDNNGVTDIGSVYIYKRDDTITEGSKWGNPIPLTLPRSTDDDPTDDTGLEASSRFGRSISISGNYAIVGANGDDHIGGEDAGSAYTYNRDTGTENWHLSAATTRVSTQAFAGCAAVTGEQEWTVGTNTCSANVVLPIGGHSDTYSFYNSVSGLNGFGTFICNDGTWELDTITTATCAPVLRSYTERPLDDKVLSLGDTVEIKIDHSQNGNVQAVLEDGNGNQRELVSNPRAISVRTPGERSISSIDITIPDDLEGEGDYYDLVLTLIDPISGDIISISNSIRINVDGVDESGNRQERSSGGGGGGELLLTVFQGVDLVAPTLPDVPSAYFASETDTITKEKLEMEGISAEVFLEELKATLITMVKEVVEILTAIRDGLNGDGEQVAIPDRIDVPQTLVIDNYENPGAGIPNLLPEARDENSIVFAVDDDYENPGASSPDLTIDTHIVNGQMIMPDIEDVPMVKILNGDTDELDEVESEQTPQEEQESTTNNEEIEDTEENIDIEEDNIEDLEEDIDIESSSNSIYSPVQ